MTLRQCPGAGVGLRGPHLNRILNGDLPRIDWFEVITENYLGGAGGFGHHSLAKLEKVRRNYPIATHGVCLSLGSTDPLDLAHIRRIRDFANQIEPLWVSDHMCWTSLGGEHDHDLLPIPRMSASLKHFVDRVVQVQELLGQRILIENVSSYVEFRANEMSEWEFLAELTRRSGCGLLLDVNNIYVNSKNHGFDPHHFIEGIPKGVVEQFHLAGHSESQGLLIDTHDAAVPEAVWTLYQAALTRFGARGTIVEWDAAIPSLEQLAAESDRARTYLEALEVGERPPEQEARGLNDAPRL